MFIYVSKDEGKTKWQLPTCAETYTNDSIIYEH
jgi:hypothetical protein